MSFLQEPFHSDTWYVFKLMGDCVQPIRSIETSGGPTQATTTAKRLVLHATQAFEKHVSSTPDADVAYEDFPFEHGLRDTLPIDAMPSIQEIEDYVNQTREERLTYLQPFDDDRFLANDPPKSMESNFFSIHHAIFHGSIS